MKQPIRFFTFGLLTATVILLIIYLFIESPKDDNLLSTEEMIKEIEQDGYHVLTKSEYITYSVVKDQIEEVDEDDPEEESDNNNEDNGKDDKKNKDKKDKDKKDKDKDKKDKDKGTNENEGSEKPEKEYTYTLSIEENMLGPNISDLLFENNIIDDATKFNKFLEDEGYSRYIQLGDFELSSDMSYEEIAEVIARKR